ncbi:MAG: hypothetical protein L0Z70_08825 [Chloroflexi bacterium]|nr:hypothetical protein [Chloroflexota bacterium]
MSALARLDGLVWLVILVGPFILVQRRLHLDIQAVFLLLTRRSEIAIALFSILFFPGVLLHEGSHYLMARLLGVRTGRFSLIPRPLPDGRLQLGYVETAAADFLRDALIGAAPLFSGLLLVAYAGWARLGLPQAWEGLSAGGLAATAASVYQRPDFWLWFYLILTVSSTMLPSRSDRRAWLPMAIAFAALLGVSLWAGAGPWMAQTLTAPVNILLRSIGGVIAVSLGAHLVLLLPTLLLKKLLERLSGLRAV